MRTTPSTPEEDARIQHDKLVGLAIIVIWWVPGVLLSLVVDDPLPLLAAVVLGLAHASLVGVRTARARRAHRIAFWAGKTDVRERPLGRITDEIRARRRDTRS